MGFPEMLLLFNFEMNSAGMWLLSILLSCLDCEINAREHSSHRMKQTKNGARNVGLHPWVSPAAPSWDIAG